MKRSGGGAATRALLLVCLGFAGCTFVDIAWRFADDAIISRADYWLDLDEAQQQALAERLEPWLAGQRREHLPRVAAFLRELARRTDKGFDQDDVRWADRRTRALYRATATDLIELLVPTLQSLEPGQRAHLRQRMDQRNARYRDRFVTVSAYDRARAIGDRIIEQVERWTGPLERQQRVLVYQRSAELPDTAADWHGFRARMQARLLELLEQDASAARISRHLRSWWIEFEPRAPEQVAATDALRADVRDLLVDLAGSLTPAQRVSATRRLRSLADDLVQLARTEQTD